MDALDKYMAEARRAPFGYDGLRGETHCCFFPAGAALAQTGRDPAAPFRARVRDQSAAQDLFAGSRGIVGLLDAAFRSEGFRRTWWAVRGDCGCVQVRLPGEAAMLAGAVRYDDAWWLKSVGGLARLAAGQVRLIVAWEVGCRPSSPR